jgi:hypothetical protein
MNQDRGEVTITLGGVELDLVFRARALMALSKLSGMAPPVFFARFEGINFENEEEIAPLCDFDIVVPLICAGLVTHPRYGKRKAESLSAKVCELLEQEADKLAVPLLQMPLLVMNQIFGAVLGGMGMLRDKEENKAPEAQDSKNDETPASVSAPAERTNGPGDA